MILLTNVEDSLDRLICADFYFEYNKENDYIIFKSYPHRENSSNLFGFSYWGEAQQYYVDLKEIHYALEEYLGAAFDRYKELMTNGIKQRLDSLKEELL